MQAATPAPDAAPDNSVTPRGVDPADLLGEVLAGKAGALRTTEALAETVRKALGRRPEAETELSVRRVFQALRIEVNDEFGSLDALLRDLPQALRPGGRVAILTFHSGEDRRVKKAFIQGERDGHYSSIAPDVIRAGTQERFDNPRSKSAKLRWARRACGLALCGSPSRRRTCHRRRSSSCSTPVRATPSGRGRL